MRSAMRDSIAKSLQVPRSQTAGRLAVQRPRPSMKSTPCPPSAARVSLGQFDLPRAEDLGVAGQYLLDERRAGSRQPHDEHRELAFQPEAADALEEIRRADRDHPGDEQLVLFRVVLLAALAPLGRCSALPRSRCSAASAYSPRASRTWARPKCKNNRWRPSNPAPPATGAAQPDRSPEVCRPGVPPICNARRRSGNLAATRRGSSLPRPEDRPSPPKRCPGCCVPRHSPASAPVRGGSRRPHRPASPGPSSVLPRLLCASA
jgi:hypothetical protein